MDEALEGVNSTGSVRIAVGAPSAGPPIAEEQLRNIEALIDYVAELGLDPEGAVLAPALDALSRYRSAADPASARLDAAKELLRLDVQLGGLTGSTGVTGRSIRSSSESLRHLTWIRICGMALLGCAISAELLVSSASQPYQQALGGYAIPFFWGGIGATVFLMKTITDRASELTFDARKMQGLPERILLGALCGTIVVNLLGVEAEGLTKAAIGFLAGLGTKAVYATFETMVNGIAERVGGKRPPGG